MKKRINLKKVLAFALLAGGLFVYSAAHSKKSTIEIVPAWGCKYTGNFFDTCNYGMYSIYNCLPGSTSCGYNPPREVVLAE